MADREAGADKRLLAGLGGLAVLTAVTVGSYVSYDRQEIALRNRIAAQQQAVELQFDANWKIIAQQAQVAERYREAFAEVYPALMAARQPAEGGALSRWVQEHNPQLDPALYQQLARSIEAQRVGFAREQTVLLDLKREHDTLLHALPSRLFVGGRAPVTLRLVTSAHTQATFAGGREDDVKVFGSE